MDRISVLIVDDHAVVRQGLQSFLGSEEGIEVVGEASNGAEAVQRVEELLPDVVLMDLVMPGMDGITAIRKICETSPATRVLVLTSYGEDEKIFASIKAGALGYLLKDVPAEDLSRAIHSVAKGELLLHPEIARKVLDEFAAARQQASLPAGLTPREKEVLILVAKGWTNKAIAQELTLSIKTVKTHVSNILTKLHTIDRAQAAIYAIRQGLVLPDEDSPQARS